MIQATIQALSRAIQARQNVSFVYDGYYRECSPHALGYKGEKVNVLVYQFAGSTSSGPIGDSGPNNWKCMDVAKIVGIESIDGEWHTFENHTRPSTCIDHYLEQVDY